MRSFFILTLAAVTLAHASSVVPRSTVPVPIGPTGVAMLTLRLVADHVTANYFADARSA